MVFQKYTKRRSLYARYCHVLTLQHTTWPNMWTHWSSHWLEKHHPSLRTDKVLWTQSRTQISNQQKWWWVLTLSHYSPCDSTGVIYGKLVADEWLGERTALSADQFTHLLDLCLQTTHQLPIQRRILPAKGWTSHGFTSVISSGKHLDGNVWGFGT